MSTVRSAAEGSTAAAVEALARGYTAIPIKNGEKKPYGTAWTQIRWESPDQVTEAFDRFAASGASNVGLLLGEPSGGLVDVDLDHLTTLRIGRDFLPKTAMRHGRPGRPASHYWYRVTGDLPAYRKYKMPDGETAVELRSDGAQTLIPPSVWYPREWTGDQKAREHYRWEGEPWGGAAGPAEVDGGTLAKQVALLALGAVLLDGWPRQGSRHDAYLALAGGLLRYGDEVHPFWERNLPKLIEWLALVTHDDDGPGARVAESMESTMARLRAGETAVGFTRLEEHIGADHVDAVRRHARDVESLAGFKSIYTQMTAAELVEAEIDGAVPAAPRNPVTERSNSWQPVDLEPYLYEGLEEPIPTLLRRSDDVGILYEGLRNTLVGPSEQGKTFVALIACAQQIADGNRVLYIDLEDSAKGIVKRALLLGIGRDDLGPSFGYIQAYDPISDLEVRWGRPDKTDIGLRSTEALAAAIERFDPALIVVDGTTTLYRLHGLDTNDSVGTDVVSGWLRQLTRERRCGLIQIDHTPKSGGLGTGPSGSQHKVATVDGAILSVTSSRGYLVRGQVNTIVISVVKDRPGVVREHSTNEETMVAAEVVLDSRVEGVVRWSVNPPSGLAVTINLADHLHHGDTPEQAERRRRAEANAVALAAQKDALEADYRERILTAYKGEIGSVKSNSNYFGWVLGISAEAVKALPLVDRKAMVAARESLVAEGWLGFLPGPRTEASWTFTGKTISDHSESSGGSP